MFKKSFLILAAAFLASALAHQKYEPDLNTLSVTGVGRRTYKNNIATVRLGVETTGKTAVEVQRKLARESSRLVAYLKRQNVQKLQTRGITLSAVRNFSADPPMIVGYSGSNSVSFEVPINRAGAILDGSIANGATEISSISFKGSPATTEAARQGAIEDAVFNARKEATIAAKALGQALGAPKEVRIVDTFTPMSREAPKMKAFASLGGPPTPVEGGEGSVTANVAIKFQIVSATRPVHG